MDLNEAMEKAQAHLEAQAEPEPMETVEAEPVAEAAPEPEAASAPDRARDESGKFAKAPKQKAAKVIEKSAATAPKGDVHGAARTAPPAGQGQADGAAPSPAPSAEPVKPAEALKPPSSLRPAAKEAFAKAPREVQEDMVRIDREVRQVMQEAAEAKRLATQVHQRIAPYEPIARANGMDALQFADSGAQAMAAVYAGAPQAAAAVIANAIAVLEQRTGGQAIDLINAVRQGQPAQHAPQPQVDPRQEIRKLWEEERAQRERAETRSLAEAFLAKDHEFLDDVMPHFTALVQAEVAKGRNMTEKDLHDLLDAARWANPEVRAQLQKRQAAEAARTRTAATAQARAAAVSIKSQPAAPMSAKPKGLDAAMSAAREKLGL